MRSYIIASIISFAASTASATGIPFLIMEDNVDARLTNIFVNNQPSDVWEISVTGTVTEAIGAPSLAGTDVTFRTIPFDLFNPQLVPELTLDGSTVFGGFDIGNPSDRGFDPFGPLTTPGNLEFQFVVAPPVTPGCCGTNASDPLLQDVTYQGAYSAYDGPAFRPELSLQLNIFYDGALPTRTVDGFTVIGGGLDVTRITLGNLRGDPVPVIPLPATLPMLVGALGACAALRQRRK